MLRAHAPGANLDRMAPFLHGLGSSAVDLAEEPICFSTTAFSRGAR